MITKKDLKQFEDKLGELDSDLVAVTEKLNEEVAKAEKDKTKGLTKKLTQEKDAIEKEIAMTTEAYKTATKAFDLLEKAKKRDIMDIRSDDESDAYSIIEMFSDMELTGDGMSEIMDMDMSGFGLMSSKEYKKRMDDLTKGMLAQDKVIIMVLCVVVKNKHRILGSLDKFKDKSWFASVKAFFEKKTVHYTSEAVANKLMPVVNIPTSNPPLACIAWMLVNKRWSVKAFMSNLWAGQLSLSTSLQEEHKKWEFCFWEITVKKSKSSAYEKGFNEDYYETKEFDRYPLMNIVDQLWFKKEKSKNTGTGYSKEDILEYLKVTATYLNACAGREVKTVSDDISAPLVSSTEVERAEASKKKREEPKEEKKTK